LANELLIGCALPEIFWISRACLPPPSHYGFSSKRLPLLAAKVHYSGARGVPFTALLPHTGCMSLAAITCPPLRRNTTHAFTPIRFSCFVPYCGLEPGLHDLGAREAYILTLFRPRLVPRCFSRVVA
jgi:hypothetical protein